MGYPGGVFEGSSLGRVRIGGDVREGTPDKDGYLRSKHRGRWYSHAEIVCMAWHGPPEVRHLNADGNRQSNKPAELAWGSKRDNEKDKRENRRGRNIGHRPVPLRTS